MRSLVGALAALRQRAEVVLVSSGAIAAGLGPLGLGRRPRALAAQQAAASVGQGLLVHRYTEEFARHGLVTGQVLLTLGDVTRRSHYRNAFQTFAKLLDLGVVPVVNENDTVATTEIRFGDNDRLAALVAHLVHADLLVLLSDVDGLYDGPPGPGAVLVSEVADVTALTGVRVTDASSGVGTGGMRTKLEAARIATAAGIPVVLTAGLDLCRSGRWRGGGHPVSSNGQTSLHPAALAGARHGGEGRLATRRRRRPGPHSGHRVAAPCRGHRRGRGLRGG